MTKKCDKLRQSLLATTDAAAPAHLLLMWDHAIAIGEISPAPGETLHNPPDPPSVDPTKDTNIQMVDWTTASSAGQAGLSVPTQQMRSCRKTRMSMNSRR
jgi:hypothetical protein